MNYGDSSHCIYDTPGGLSAGKTGPKLNLQSRFLLQLFFLLLHLDTTSSMCMLHKQFPHHCVGNSLLNTEMSGFMYLSATILRETINM